MEQLLTHKLEQVNIGAAGSALTHTHTHNDWVISSTSCSIHLPRAAFPPVGFGLRQFMTSGSNGSYGRGHSGSMFALFRDISLLPATEDCDVGSLLEMGYKMPQINAAFAIAGYPHQRLCSAT
eukprot:746598-Amphidinium_carterae.1